MSYFGFRPYVPVAKRRALAAREVEKLAKKGRVVTPVTIEGREIARSFWGKAWCENLERYSDFENRLPRGRTYVRNGSVVDLQIERGRVRAMVCGSEIYDVKIDIATVASSRWKAICTDCARSIGSLVELLQGKLSNSVMERVCREGDGLFPVPREIRMSCTCPDWAGMCKHVAATLYGAGARFDRAPELLFALRGVDRAALIGGVGADVPMAQTAAASERILAGDDVAALFGIEITPAPLGPAPLAPRAEDKKAKPQPQERFPAKRNPIRISPAMFRNSDIDAKSRQHKNVERVSDSTGSDTAPGRGPARAAEAAGPRGKKTPSKAARGRTREPAALESPKVAQATGTRAAPKETHPGENGARARADGLEATSLQKDARPGAVVTTPEEPPSRPERRKQKAEAGSRRDVRTRAAKWIGARGRKTGER